MRSKEREYEIVLCRTSSVTRDAKRVKTFKDSADKAETIRKAVSRYEKQSNVFKNLSASKSNVTEASTFLECSEVLFDGISNKHMIISRTVERRISEMADDESEQLTAALTTTPVFSVALDESVDINDGIVTQMQEELCCLKPMYGTTNGEDILKTFTDYFEDRGINIREVFAVITDGAPAMFQAFLEEVDSAYKDILLYSNVRWLSCGKVLERFVECLNEIKILLSEKDQDYPELEDRN
ncbi:general transcription factor II-I repeat domain-containing protein 2A-like [Penaeus vannamei]|uniref:general transcription factor II-I repeat domain-containing protein 2A-like n=1 Tax=Penaeus vannamei TaxID=6689 RepID=UPI00387F868C